MFSSGQTEKLCIPYNEWSAGIHGGYFDSFVKTVNGFVFLNSNTEDTYRNQKGLAVQRNGGGRVRQKLQENLDLR